MLKVPATAYLTVAVLAVVTIIGVNFTETVKTGNVALAQAMFTDDLGATQKVFEAGQIANHDTASNPSDLH
jgi:hypothetical protein